jgi:hypothetical protein
MIMGVVRFGMNLYLDMRLHLRSIYLLSLCSLPMTSAIVCISAVKML